MSSKSEPLETTIAEAVGAGHLLESAAQNISTLLRGAPSPFYEQVVAELAAKEEWEELNDRFYKTLAFGTGGLRGRTIGKIVTKAERGEAGENERPQFPCVGTNAMNFFNVSRATQGARRLSARVARPGKDRGKTEDRDRSRLAAFLERIYRARCEDRRGKWL